jgi:hypothetical protein
MLAAQRALPHNGGATEPQRSNNLGFIARAGPPRPPAPRTFLFATRQTRADRMATRPGVASIP